MLLLALLAAARATCPQPVSPAAWSQAMDTAEERFRDLDPDRFEAAVDELEGAFACLSGPISRDQASRFHLLRGLAGYARGQAEVATRSFAAARAVRPAARIPHALVPEGHEVHELVEGARTPGVTAEAAPPAQGTLSFDGEPTLARPADRPTLAQWLREDGVAGRSAYLLPADALLVYPVAPVEPLAPAPAGRRGPSSGRVALGIGAGLCAVGGAALYGLAVREAGHLDGPHPPSATVDDLRGIQGRANRLVGVSAGLAGLALLGGIGFAVVR